MSEILMMEMESMTVSPVKPEERVENTRSFLLVDEQENLQVHDEEEFLNKLGCADVAGVKVLSIFGNTGDGKSHTLNHILFDGQSVFYTSKSPSSCTVGVWAAYNPSLSLLALDTEGLLGAAANQNQRMRLLLKVLAVSDIVVYRTRAERLHNDMFHFLSSASRAYLKHFSRELKALSSRCGLDVPLSCLGPSVIVFQETTHTQLLGHDSKGHADTLLQKRFHDLGLGTEAFSSVEYVGTQTVVPPTDYSRLLVAVRLQVKNTHTRSPRQPGIVFRALEALSKRFCGELSDDKMTLFSFFPDEYFTCSSVCLSCNIRCKNGMNHVRDRIPHMADGLCQFAHQYNNKVLICKRCYEGGREVIVVPKTSASSDNPWFGLAKYAWSGYVLECASCGVIYRSRQYWLGNQDPESSVVRSEIKHVWQDSDTFLTSHQNAAQRVLDGMSFVIQSVSEYSTGPTKAVTAWLTDQVAPPYWRPNAEITACHECKKVFEEAERKHHCRSCGEGFCHPCSNNRMPVPERGWGSSPVRVCQACYRQGGPTDTNDKACKVEPSGLIARRVTEVAQSTLDMVTTAVDYPLCFVKDVARPDYWVPDQNITQCHQCSKTFTAAMSKHHCRACGQGVCGRCSTHIKAVPSRGWDHPVRVCDGCFARTDPL
ncbi:zinc finger FYVE domain-containing protein 1 isoform X2 [Austrofundulus limnaeus]|uniref:Zinc finger FYVE domain-containing protein 1 isoform X2 n=1 Tax=Austrofundulus limnaeus TaxID=52670 RepID=A0A2I4BRT5_AUSLI|nr:PREDICTED: zinc finger FYVE domain-containing protein 1-like isoform X2 [Austrofundulus limnaeus]